MRWSADLRYQRPGDPTGFPPDAKLMLMRKADDPDFRLDWAAWAAVQEGQQDVQKHRSLPDDMFDFSPPDAPWLVRWQNYWAAAA